MADYNSSYTGAQIDTAVGAALNPDTAPTASSSALVTSGGVAAGLATKADKTDLAAIQATGTSNLTGAAIPAGTYFYLNGTLVRAIGDGISSGMSFTLNTNYSVVTAGALNELKSALNTKLKFQNVHSGASWPCGDIGSVLLSGLVGNVGNKTFLITLYFGVVSIMCLDDFSTWTNTSAFNATWSSYQLTLTSPYYSEFVMLDLTRNGN